MCTVHLAGRGAAAALAALCQVLEGASTRFCLVRSASLYTLLVKHMVDTILSTCFSRATTKLKQLYSGSCSPVLVSLRGRWVEGRSLSDSPAG